MHQFSFFSQDIIVLLVPWFGFHFLQILFIWYRRSMLCFLIKPLVNKFSSWVTTDCNFRFFLKKIKWSWYFYMGNIYGDIFFYTMFVNEVSKVSNFMRNLNCFITFCILLLLILVDTQTLIPNKAWLLRNDSPSCIFMVNLVPHCHNMLIFYFVFTQFLTSAVRSVDETY